MTKTLNKKAHRLASANVQLAVLGNEKLGFPSFGSKVVETQKEALTTSTLEILQVNLGKMCNQVCEHCHVDAGPDRKEIMSKEVMQHCLKWAALPSVTTVDLTGGAPEMNPNFKWFVEELSKLNVEIIVRSNLTILTTNKFADMPEFFKKHKVTVVSSMPCYSAANVDKQRGNGVFDSSISALQTLNKLGYGLAETGLKLHLVYNPGGASLPPDQMGLQADYKRELAKHFDISFNELYTITNLPISRFLDFLLTTEQYEKYMQKLVDAFNPLAVEGLMCRNTVSVGYDGQLFDCDFNQMLELPLVCNSGNNIANVTADMIENRPVVTRQHCYGCTAGAGSSCQGAVA